MAFALNSRRITLIVAVTIALAAGLLTIRYLSTAQRASDNAATVAMFPEIVASRTIHPHEKIVAEMLTHVVQPASHVEVGAFTDPREAIGNVALIEIPEGSPLTEAKVGVPAITGITAKLKPGMRAISIPVDFIKSVSSLVQPGDRVDVLASNTRGNPHPTRAIIRGALVLAVNTALDPIPQPSPASATPTSPSSVTLAVTPDQANILTFADNTTLLRLALRSPEEPIRAFPVQALDFGSSGDGGNALASHGTRNEAPSTAAVAPTNANVPPPTISAVAPAAVPPTTAPGPDSSPRTSPILVIEGDQIVAGQR